MRKNKLVNALLLGLIGSLIFSSSSEASTNQISAATRAKHDATMVSIGRAIQAYNDQEIAIITTFNGSLVARDDALTAALESAWDPTSTAGYADQAPYYLALANAWANARVTASQALSSVYTKHAQRDISDRAAANLAAVALYAFEVKLSSSKSTNAIRDKALALYKAQANAKAKALKLKGNASDAALQSAGNTYVTAANAAEDAYKNKLETAKSYAYFFSVSDRSVASDNALKAYVTAYNNDFDQYNASTRANESELYAALAALATSLPKLPNSPEQALAAAYADAAK